MSKEKFLERSLYNNVKLLGGWAVKFWPVTLVGFPDRIILLPGASVKFVELKTTGKKPTPKQTLMMEKLKRLGFDVRVIDSEEKLNQLINDCKHAIQAA